MVINADTFISDIVLFIRNYLRTNITDPVSRSSAQFVMTSYPKREVQYPLITIKSTGITTSKLGIGSSTNRADVKIEVRVWSKNSKEADTITQEVINDMKDAQYAVSGTGAENIFGFKLNSCVPIVEDNGDNTVHSKVMEYTYVAILD